MSLLQTNQLRIWVGVRNTQESWFPKERGTKVPFIVTTFSGSGRQPSVTARMGRRVFGQRSRFVRTAGGGDSVPFGNESPALFDNSTITDAGERKCLLTCGRSPLSVEASFT